MKSILAEIWTWSDSLLGRMIPDFQVRDSEIASALKKLLTTNLMMRVCTEEQKAPQDDRFLTS